MGKGNEEEPKGTYTRTTNTCMLFALLWHFTPNVSKIYNREREHGVRQVAVRNSRKWLSPMFVWLQPDGKGRASGDKVNSKSSEKAGIQTKNDLEINAPHELSEILRRAFDFSNLRMEAQTNLLQTGRGKECLADIKVIEVIKWPTVKRFMKINH